MGNGAMGPGSGHWDLEKAHGTDRVKIVTKNCNGIVMPTEILDSGMPWNTFGGARWPSLNALESVPDERAAVPWRNMTPTFEHYIPLASDVWLSSCGTNACFVGAHWKHKAPHTTNTPGPQTPWCWLVMASKRRTRMPGEHAQSKTRSYREPAVYQIFTS